MYYPSQPAIECSSEEVFDCFIEDDEKKEVETQLGLINRFTNAFFQISLDEFSIPPSEEVEESFHLINQTYRIQNAL